MNRTDGDGRRKRGTGRTRKDTKLITKLIMITRIIMIFDLVVLLFRELPYTTTTRIGIASREGISIIRVGDDYFEGCD